MIVLKLLFSILQLLHKYMFDESHTNCVMWNSELDNID